MILCFLRRRCSLVVWVWVRRRDRLSFVFHSCVPYVVSSAYIYTLNSIWLARESFWYARRTNCCPGQISKTLTMFQVAVVKQHVLGYLPIVLSVDHISRKIFKKKQYEVFMLSFVPERDNAMIRKQVIPTPIHDHLHWRVLMNPVTPKMPNCIVQYRPSVICETNSNRVHHREKDEKQARSKVCRDATSPPPHLAMLGFHEGQPLRGGSTQ